ncbi:MAG: hypothetical protein AAF719_11395 [Pseudomonadota bacterium]
MIQKLKALSLSWAAWMVLTSPALATPAHPLDPLSWDEHWDVLTILADEGKLTDDTRFSRVTFAPPEKRRVWSWRKGQSLPRKAIAFMREGPTTIEATLDLKARRITDWVERTDVQPIWLEGEYGSDIVDKVKEDPRYAEALEKRGIEYPMFVDCSPGPRGFLGEAELADIRFGVVSCGYPVGARNSMARRIEGFTVIVDMHSKEILEFRDDEIVNIHDTIADYDLGSLGPLREFDAPIKVEQPKGHGFTLDGNMVKWDNWRFHVRPDHRLGIIVSTVTWNDEDRERPVMYEGHLSEMFVPYMAPQRAWRDKNFIDAGEYSTGGIADPLEPGLHCPETAVFMDEIVADDTGRPKDRRRAVCLFEAYSGDINWLHKHEGRPKRELIARTSARLGNYDYIIDFRFQTDGQIKVAAGSTGIVQAMATTEKNATEPSDSDTPADRYGRFVDDHIIGVNHSHYFSFRFDLDVDGPENSFEMTKLKQVILPEDNSRRSLWVTEPVIAKREENAKLRKNLNTPAVWRFINPDKKNAHGYSTSFQIAGGMTARTLLSEDDYPRRRAGFIDHDFWVTPYKADELYAAGLYPTESKPGKGLPEWTAENRPIENTDIVAWYTMGMHHVVRAEDWPVMPIVWHDVMLRPFDFFDENPAMTSGLKP